MILWCGRWFHIPVLVDEEDWRWAVDQGKWLVTHSGDPSPKKYAYRCRAGTRSLAWLHKEICLRHHGPPPAGHVIGDHMDGNSLNNRKGNLRWATPQMNSRNRHGIAVLQMELGI